MVKTAFNDAFMPRNPFASYTYSTSAPELIFLTEDELRKLQTMPLRKGLHFVRDMFLFSCFTGICHADMRALTWKQFEQGETGAWWVSGRRVKTKTLYVVKLLSQPLAIVDKYRGFGSGERVFTMTAVASMNRLLLQVMQACGIEKHITFHCARHTFATTVCLMNDVPLETLSKMMGHKNITTTQVYAKITAPMIDRSITRLERRIGDKYAM